MSTSWIYRIHVIISASNQAVLNALWTVIAPEGDAEADTYGISLSPTGTDPATHLGCSTAGTPVMRGMIEAMATDELASIAFYICDAATGELLAQQNGALTVGQAVMWADALADQGLQVIAPPEEI